MFVSLAVADYYRILESFSDDTQFIYVVISKWAIES